MLCPKATKQQAYVLQYINQSTITMIYKMIDLPSNVIGFKALWQVTDKDVEEVITPTVADHVEKIGQSNFLLVLQDLNRNFKLQTMKTIDHLNNLGHKLKRIAVVADANSANKVIKDLGDDSDFVLRGFSHEELKEAIDWASESK